MRELNIKDVFRTERLRQMNHAPVEHTSSLRRNDKTSIKAGMEALMKELLGHTQIDAEKEESTPFHADYTIH